MRYIALVRGINVGKKNWIPMDVLMSIFVNLGYRKVKTYINSGNVLFDSDDTPKKIQRSLEAAISGHFGETIPVIVKTQSEIAAIREIVPEIWQNDKQQSTNVVFLFPEIDREEIIQELPVKTEFVEFIYTKGALIWNIKRENLNKSRITNLSGHKFYRRMTIRNVNTLRKLAEM